MAFSVDLTPNTIASASSTFNPQFPSLSIDDNPGTYWSSQDVAFPAILQFTFDDFIVTDNTFGATATADSEFAGGFEAFNIIDDNTGTSWASTNTALPHFIQVDYGVGNSEIINSYSMTSFGALGNDDRAPKDFTLEASNTGAFSGEETVLDTRTNITFSSNERKTFSNFSGGTNATSFRFYRFVITANDSGTFPNLIQFAELELGTEIGISGGEIINQYTITARNSGGGETRAPKDFTFEGSNDNFSSDINVLDTQTGQTFTFGEQKTFNSFSGGLNSTIYTAYRIRTTDNNFVGDNFVQIAEAEIMTLLNEELDIQETIEISDDVVITTNPEILDIQETIEIRDCMVAFSPVDISFVSRMLFTNPLYGVTNTDPAKVVEVDISNPLIPLFIEAELVGAKFAKDIALNTTTDFLYIACADGIVVKVQRTNLSNQTLIDLNDTDDLETIATLSQFALTYAGTENTDAELYMIDEREIETLNTDFKFLESRVSRFDNDFNFTEAETLETDFKFISEINVSLKTDFKFLSDTFDAVACNPIPRTDFRVFIDNVELVSTDLILPSILIQHNIEEKSTATFTLTRRHDDLNTNLDGSFIEITNKNLVRVEIDGTIEFDGQIGILNATYTEGNESVAITALADEKPSNFNNVELSLPSLDEQLNLFHIISHSPEIVDPEVLEDDENPRRFKGVKVNLGDIVRQSLTRFSSFQEGTSLASQIIDGKFNPDQNFTYFWFLRAQLLVPNITAQNPTNDGGSNLQDGFLPTPDFPTNEFPNFNFGVFEPQYTDFSTQLAVSRFVGTSLSGLSSDLWDLISVNFKKQRIFDDIITPGEILDEFTSTGASLFTLTDNPTLGFSSIIQVLVNGFPVEFTFINPNQVNITDGTNAGDLVKIEYGVRDFAVGEAPFQTVSVRNGVFIPKERWAEREDGFYLEKDDGFNFDEYAKEVARLEFEKLSTINNEALPEVTDDIEITLDSYYFYGLSLLSRINITNTTKANIYNNNNGFPINIKGITISAQDMNVTLLSDNIRSTQEVQDIDSQFPDEEDERFNFKGFSVRQHTKLDLSSRREVE